MTAISKEYQLETDQLLFALEMGERQITQINPYTDTVDVVILSDPAWVDFGSGPVYWIFEMLLINPADESRRPLADRAVLYREECGETPEALAGESWRLTGRWQSDKCLRISHMEPVSPV